MRAPIQLLLCAVAFGSPLAAQRRPLTATPVTRISHKPTGTRLKVGPDGKAPVPYAVEGSITPSGVSGSFAVAWTGRDGNRRTVTYELRSKARATVATRVTFDSASRLYTYSYEISNLLNSPQAVKSLYVEAAGPQRGAGPSEAWYSTPLTDYLHKQLDVASGWTWSIVDGTHGIAAGQSLAGFQIVSRNAPGIVKCFIAGWTPRLEADEDMPDELVAGLDAVSWLLPNGSCLGPAVSSTAGANGELLRVADALRVAQAEGWLGRSATLLRGDVDALTTAARRGDSVVARQRKDTILRGLTTGAAYDGLLDEGKALVRFGIPAVRSPK